MRILYKFPCRFRVDKMFSAIDNIIEMSSSNSYLIQMTLDADDSMMANEQVRNRLSKYGDKVVAYYGFSKSKIDAVNRDMEFAADYDIIIVMSDDMVIIKKGFDADIIKSFCNNFYDTDGLLHIHDGNQGRLATMAIIGRKFFNRFGYIYHPEYFSVYCDNHAQEVAKKLGKYHYMGDDVRLIIHKHPLFGHKDVEMDSQYKYTESFYRTDEATFKKWEEKNFGL